MAPNRTFFVKDVIGKEESAKFYLEKEKITEKVETISIRDRSESGENCIDISPTSSTNSLSAEIDQTTEETQQKEVTSPTCKKLGKKSPNVERPKTPNFLKFKSKCSSSSTSMAASTAADSKEESSPAAAKPAKDSFKVKYPGFSNTGGVSLHHLDQYQRRDSSTLLHKGGCHCGSVRFEVYAPAMVNVIECNCSICHKKQNHHFIVPMSHFKLIKGHNSLTTYSFNTHQAKHTFCSTCGVEAFYIPRSNPDGYGINIYSIDEGSIKRMKTEKFDGKNWEKTFEKSEIAKYSRRRSSAAGLI